MQNRQNLSFFYTSIKNFLRKTQIISIPITIATKNKIPKNKFNQGNERPLK
jgi:hypothetical protein